MRPANNWYHGSLSREVAEKLLYEYSKQTKDDSVTFLVRLSSGSQNDSKYVLSISFQNNFTHYSLSTPEETFFNLCDGPVIHGLDEIIKYYYKFPLPTGLPLGNFPPGLQPPWSQVKYGVTTDLHRAIIDGNDGLVWTLFPKYDINSKDENGDSCLHLACRYNRLKCVRWLLNKGVEIDVFNAKGWQPIHECCKNLRAIEILSVLIVNGCANIQARCLFTGDSALHIAVNHKNIHAVKVLFTLGSPCLPRNNCLSTPLDQAILDENETFINLFMLFKPPQPVTCRDEWLHLNLDRQKTTNLFNKFHSSKGSNYSGAFLVRPSKEQQNNSKHPLESYALCLSYKKQLYQFHITSIIAKDNRRFWYIHVGPFFPTLEHLIQHYCLYSDGLPCRLQLAVHPRSLKAVPMRIQKPRLTPTIQSIIANSNSAFYSCVTSPINRTHKEDCENTEANLSQSGDITGCEKDRNYYSTIMSHVSSKKMISSSSVNNSESSHNKLSKRFSIPAKVFLEKYSGSEDLRFTDFNCVIPAHWITKGKELGQGEFGSVFEGTITNDHSETLKVALKTLHEDNVQSSTKDFLREASVMMKLSHSCIISFVGICEGPPLMIIQELMGLGSLLDFLLDRSDEIQIPDDLYNWTSSIAKGMAYLESMRFVHRDLAARNVLLDDNCNPKITDFGLSRAIGIGKDYYKASAGGRWPVKWYAPESNFYGQFSHAGDVWSYGITLWEIYSFGDEPYGDQRGPDVIKFIEEGNRLSCPSINCARFIYDEIILPCWKYEPSQRPTFNEILHSFQNAPFRL